MSGRKRKIVAIDNAAVEINADDSGSGTTGSSGTACNTRKKKVVEEENSDNGDSNFADQASAKCEEDPEINMPTASLKILSWNVNGLRAWFTKHSSTALYIAKKLPDIICFQEVRCSEGDAPIKDMVKQFGGGYSHHYWCSSGEGKNGYAGVAMFSRTKPLSVSYGLSGGKFDHDGGRILTAEFGNFYLVNAYVQNSGRGLPKLDYRTQSWEPDFRAYLSSLDAKKPVILCGDLNVAHKEIDLANPKSNHKTAGFTPQERAEFDKLLKCGFVDVYRNLYPKKEGAYTFWSNRGNARSNNVGWRLDYFVVSQRLIDSGKIIDCHIGGRRVEGSDHCPLILYGNL